MCHGETGREDGDSYVSIIHLGLDAVEGGAYKLGECVIELMNVCKDLNNTKLTSAP